MDTILKKDLIKALGADILPEAEQVKMVEEIGRVVYARIMSRAIPLLSNIEKEEFQKVLDDTNEENSDVFDYLNSKIPNLESIVQEEISSFKDTSLNVMSQIG